MLSFIDESTIQLLQHAKVQLAPKVADIISVEVEKDIARLKPEDFGERYLKLPKLVEYLITSSNGTIKTAVTYHILVISALSFDRTDAVLNIPDSFSPLYNRYFKTLCKRAETLDNILTNGDTFQKDLGICTGKLILAGARVLGEDAFPRSMLLKGGVRQFFAMLSLLVKTGFRSSGFSTHVHLGYLNEFDAKGWRNTLKNYHQLVVQNPSVEYIFTGGAWIYDPALFKISPHLKYHVDDGLAAGAIHLYEGKLGPDCGALSTSKTRQKLYNEGKYSPRNYFMIWHRDNLIRNINKL